MPTCSDPAVLALLEENRVQSMVADRGARTRRGHSTTARHFRGFLAGRGELPLDVETVEAWIRDRLDHCQPLTVRSELFYLQRLLSELEPNPVEIWRRQHGGGTGVLDAIRLRLQPAPQRPRFSSALAADMEAFLAHKQGLGLRYVRVAAVLRSFDRFLQVRGVSGPEAVDARLLGHFVASMGNLKISTRNQNQYMLKYFIRYLRRVGRIDGEPEAHLHPRVVRRPRIPYIFRIKELAAVLAAVRGRDDWNARTFFTALHVIYACGLRLGEAVNLGADDVDLEAGTLWIKRTKFGKSRRIPVGRRALEYLSAYRQERRHRWSSGTSRFFVDSRGRAVTGNRLREVFNSACQAVGAWPQDRPIPRIHDLRHSFAVHRLHKWYADSIHPQDKLVLLSVYMGHVNYACTERYLQLTTDLLRQAGSACGRSFDTLLPRWEEPLGQ